MPFQGGRAASSSQALRPGLLAPKGTEGYQVIAWEKNKGFGCAGLRLNPDTVAYSVYMTLGNLASLPLFSY